MPVVELASFPNSRNRNRAPTLQAITYQTAISYIGQPLVMVSPANANRTYIVLENFSLDTEMFYLYAGTLNIDPTVTATFGVEEQLIYNNVSNTLYQKQDSGVTTNWLVVQPEDVGQKLLQAQVASLESLEDIYMLANALGAGTYIVGVDEGRG